MSSRVLLASEHWTHVEPGEYATFRLVDAAANGLPPIFVKVRRQALHGRTMSAVAGWSWEPKTHHSDSRMHAQQNARASGVFKPQLPSSRPKTQTFLGCKASPKCVTPISPLAAATPVAPLVTVSPVVPRQQPALAEPVCATEPMPVLQRKKRPVMCSRFARYCFAW